MSTNTYRHSVMSLEMTIIHFETIDSYILIIFEIPGWPNKDELLSGM